MEVSGQLHAPAALSQRIEPPYPLHTRLCVTRAGVDNAAKRKVLPCRELNPSLLAGRLVAIGERGAKLGSEAQLGTPLQSICLVALTCFQVGESGCREDSYAYGRFFFVVFNNNMFLQCSGIIFASCTFSNGKVTLIIRYHILMLTN
jgi:hypothetical protein